MSTWQAILVHLGLVAGAAALPTIKDETAKAVVGALVGTGTIVGAVVNSNTDSKGKKIKKSLTTIK